MKSSLSLFKELSQLLTEQQNPRTLNIDELSPLEIVRLINEEDKTVASAVEAALPEVARAIEIVVKAFKQGGRLIYIGAGTSGRLGILDASECPPTFGVPPTMVQGIIAGGRKAVFRSVEGAEDDADAGIEALKKIHFSRRDVLCGISASKRTPFVIGALNYARSLGAKTIFLTSNPDVKQKATVVIRTLVGPEVIMGSTRMKAGTSHKMVLNMISTGAMICLGKTYGNLMVDLQQTNRKLQERTKRIFMLATGDSYESAETYLAKAKGSLKLAILMRLSGLPYTQAKATLQKADGFIKKALKLAEQTK
ncbi:MAG: N-acetylmuramic acid 6-phosphate etherase [Chloroherpetonaceae bacterium]|nr:N-acetylmuramic acid 6-phosphate etherase [Chloroherpetonaceae bacterium]MCS7211520.1 N-acetylmuramic acid 6-phosphate etherase [Chloroherpetonaceae bacterium]MDW8019846.1 N-acetylmuramic acid 6-phosphate etherase [Chloroherpetonaceae bacterium]MDW8465087.1 N-acetylmuramic acid 6-phosphate etherase [Chloroherpetonaceae bacterium]